MSDSYTVKKMLLAAMEDGINPGNTIEEIITDQLELVEAIGLVNLVEGGEDVCGCGVEDLCPCGCMMPECEAAYYKNIGSKDNPLCLQCVTWADPDKCSCWMVHKPEEVSHE